MAVNPSIAIIDYQQALIRSYDKDNDALRVNIQEATSLAITLDAAEDSVAAGQLSSSNVVNLTSINTGVDTVVLAPVDIQNYSKAQIYLQSTTAIVTAAVAVKLQVSPADTGNVWIDSTLTATPDGSSGVVVMGTALSGLVARRGRLVINKALALGETADAYLVLGS